MVKLGPVYVGKHIRWRRGGAFRVPAWDEFTSTPHGYRGRHRA